MVNFQHPNFELIFESHRQIEGLTSLGERRNLYPDRYSHYVLPLRLWISHCTQQTLMFLFIAICLQNRNCSMQKIFQTLRPEVSVRKMEHTKTHHVFIWFTTLFLPSWFSQRGAFLHQRCPLPHSKSYPENTEFPFRHLHASCQPLQFGSKLYISRCIAKDILVIQFSSALMLYFFDLKEISFQSFFVSSEGDSQTGKNKKSRLLCPYAHSNHRFSFNLYFFNQLLLLP